jgi:hypothetical protein
MRHGLFGLDADEQTEGGVAAEFVQAGFGGRVTEEDGQQEDAPQDPDRVGVAAVVPAGVEGGEEGAVGDGFEGVSEGGEGGGGFEFVPGEERFGDVDDDGELLERKALRGTRNGRPRNGGSGVEKREKR